MSVPLGVYVHWPFCARICPYCDFNVHRARGQDTEPPLEAILADLAEHRTRLGRRQVHSVFLGGGTPSLMQPRQVARLLEAVQALFGLEAGAEIALEANPTDAEAGRFAALAAAGVERVSLGVQALDDEALSTLGRNHGAAEARAAVARALDAFARVSIDLIYARPGQSPRAWQGELSEAVALGAGHVSAYQLTIEPGTAFERAVRRGVLTPPDAEVGAALWDVTQSVLEQAGYDAYETSNHARTPADRSRHNLVYWRGQDWIGVGPGAHGRLVLGPVDGGAVRTATRAVLRPDAYVETVRTAGVGWDTIEALDARACAQERLLTGLRLAEGMPRDTLHPCALAVLDRHAA